MKSKIVFFIYLIIFLAVGGNCFAHNSANDQQRYKPGADVKFQHNYDGSSNIGDFENIALQFTSHSQADNKILKVTFHPTDALRIVESLIIDAKPINHIVHIPITLEAVQPGKHYLGIQVETIDSRERHSFRVFELPILVGDTTKTNTSLLNKATYSSKGRNLKILDSDESINNK